MICGTSAICGQFADDYRRTLFQLLPPGPAFDREDPELQAFLRGLSKEFVRLNARSWLAWYESDPRSTVYLIDRWEDLVGNSCGAASTVLSDRRGAVVARLTAQGGGSRAFYQAVGSAMGYALTIVEGFTGATRCGRARSGAVRSSGLDSLFRWSIYTASGSNDAELQCVIEGLKPAHTRIHWVFT